jgi:hypothetical protein
VTVEVLFRIFGPEYADYVTPGKAERAAA